MGSLEVFKDGVCKFIFTRCILQRLSKDWFKVNFATDLVIDSWNHFAALVVAHFEVESQMLTILLAFNIAYGIFEWVSKNCNKEDPVEVV